MPPFEKQKDKWHLCKQKVAKMFVSCLVFVVLFAIVKLPQSIGETNYYGKDYLIISTTRPLSVIVHRDQTYEGAEEDLANTSVYQTKIGLKEKDFALNFDKGIYFAKSKDIAKPQYGGNFICVGRYYRPTSQLLWEYSNAHTTKFMKKKSMFVKELYDKNKTMNWFGVPGINKVTFDMAYCIVASAFALYKGVYLALVEVKEMVHFILLEDIDAVKEDVGQIR